MNVYKYASKCDYDSENAETIKKLISKKPLPYKNRLLEYMRAFPCKAAAAGTIHDKISGEYTKIPILAYTEDGYFWDSSDIYYLEKYNIQPNEDFVTHILKQS